MKIDHFSPYLLDGYIISKAGLETGLDIASHPHQSNIWKLLSHKIIYVVGKTDCGSYTYNRFFIVKTENGFQLWNKDFYEIEYSDMFFTDRREATSTCERLNIKISPVIINKNSSRKIWNIILQGFDRCGKENNYSIISFTTRESAIAKFYEWMGWDKQRGYKIEEEDGYDYTYINEDGEMTRCHIVESNIFNE